MIFAIPFQNSNENYMLECEYADLQEPHPMPEYAYRAQCNAILDFDIRERLSDISAPTLVVGGDRDLLIPEWVTREMAEKIPGARLYMVRDGGHVQHWEQLEAYNKLTLDFLLEK
jgi:pimeloyl-ACP methyl ester carboxylesterase